MVRAFFLSVGLVLLFAAAAKWMALAGSTINPDQIPFDWWLSLGLTAFESFLGLWLLTGVWLRAARLLAILTFTAFTGVALYKVIQGAPSCGCLGNIELSPRYTVVFDALVAVALYRIRPSGTETLPFWAPAIYLTGVGVLVAGVCFWGFVRATDLARGLSLDANTYEFGDVEQNEVLTHTFTLRNNCTYPIEVVQTTSRCNCSTVSDVAGREVGPGESLPVPLTFRIGETEEEVIGRVTLFCRRAGTDVPATLFQDLMVSARVQPDYWVRPLFVEFGEVDDDRPRTKVVRLRPHRMPAVAVAALQPTHEAFSARVLDGRTAEGDIQIELTFRGVPLTETGTVEAPVRVTTTSPKRPTISILARAHFTSPVVVEPNAVVIPSNADGLVERQIRVTTAKPLRLTDVETTDARLRAKLVQDAAGWRIDLALPAETYRTGLTAELRFRVVPAGDTVASEARTVVIPVFRLAASGDAR